MMHRFIRLACFLALGFDLPRVQLAHAAEPPVRVLIFSGQNNHQWRETTPKIQAILEASGKCVVEVTEHPETCDAAAFAKHDVLLSNWNTFGSPTVTNWPVATRTAFLEFVRKGKGFVSLHGGSSSFYDWPEYQELVGGWWQLGQTGHGPKHEFHVQPTKSDHPITRGLTNVVTTDELWHRPGLRANIQVLATAFSASEKGGSGAEEPVAFVNSYGAGRIFNLLLGHDAKAMDAPGFQILLQRGVEWAAKGAVTQTIQAPK